MESDPSSGRGASEKSAADAPAVSICIPTYNYRRYLSDALTSCLNQTFRDIEVLVVDNCSNDGSMELVDEFARRDPRVVAHRNERNIGMAGNFNRCLELARGRYIKFLCADDTLEPGCVEALVGGMESRDGVRLAGCARQYFEEVGIPRRRVGYSRRKETLAGAQVLRDCFYKGNLIGEPTAVMFRRADAAAAFDGSYLQIFDMEYWMRLLEGGWFAFVPEPLCGIRQHPDTGSTENLRKGRVSHDKARLFGVYSATLSPRSSLPERLLWDGRMASSIAKESAAGAQRGAPDVLHAVYHPRLFKALMLPAARAAAALR
jgi:glycosyltransferase involved in cell wall biosynthesis